MSARVRTLGLCLSLLCSLGSTAIAQTPEKSFEITIPAGNLAQALEKLGEQSGLQIMYEPAAARGIRVPAVNGTITVSDALAQLLGKTGLEADRVNDKTIVLRRAEGKAETVPVEKAQSRLPPTSQSSQEPLEKLEEIVVTAQKRAERLIDVPISIVALSGEEMERRQIVNLDQLPFVVPGLAIENAGWQRRVILRGIGNVQGNFSLIGLYLDEATVTTTGVSQLDVSAYDLERVEVLRGPQGTLYGEGSAGGTIRFITRNPELDEFGVSADLTGLVTKDGAPGERIATVLNVPVIQDQLGLRIAGTYDHGGGWIDQPAVGRNDINGQNRLDVRAKALWQPTEALTVNAMTVVHRNDTSTGTGEDTAGNYTQVFNLATTPDIRDDYEVHNLTVTYDFGTFRALNAISYVDQDRESRQVGYLFPSNPGNPVSNVLQNPYRALNEILTEELRFTSTGSGPWQWTVGGTYRDAQYDLRAAFHFAVPGAPGTPLPAAVPNNNSILSKSWAIFGDSSYKLTERLTVGAGLRYYSDDQEFRTTTVQTGTFDTVNPRAYARYEFSNNFNVYTSAAKGFRSGGFNALNQPRYDPETIWTYELGTKLSVMEGRFSADVSLFYSDYSDYQVVGLLLPPAPPLNITSNAGSAFVKGIEWQLTARPGNGWLFGFNGDYLDTAFYELNVTRAPFAIGDVVPLVPKYTITTTTQREFNWIGRQGYIRLDYGVQGRMNYRNRNIGTLYQGDSDVIQTLNAAVEWQWSPNLAVMLSAENLFDDRGFTTPYHFLNNAPRAKPRTFGLRLSMSL